jgi:Cu-Zn family superoxide dismutase
MKNFKTKLIIFSVLISSIACNTENNTIIIKKTIKPVNNSSISGTITFTQDSDSVSLEAHVFGLEPGTKAIHIHEFGDCSSEDGLSTGGHWNPYDTKHSKWGDPTGFHLGAIGNFEVDSIGHGMLKFKTDLWCLGCNEENDILNKAVIIHNGADDYVSQPSGASGMRIGCMEIKIPEEVSL